MCQVILFHIHIVIIHSEIDLKNMTNNTKQSKINKPHVSEGQQKTFRGLVISPQPRAQHQPAKPTYPLITTSQLTPNSQLPGALPHWHMERSSLGFHIPKKPPGNSQPMDIPSGKRSHSDGKPPVLIGDTSSNGGFPIAMLVYRSVPSGKRSHSDCWVFPRLALQQSGKWPCSIAKQTVRPIKNGSKSPTNEVNFIFLSSISSDFGPFREGQW